MKHLVVALTAAATLAAAGMAWADGDARRGEKKFEECAACHKIERGENDMGPSLHGVFGRKAGTSDGFVYSEGMKNSGITWDDEQVAKYLHNPREFIPGNKMAFPGVAKDDVRANIIAYLKEAAK